MRRGALLLVVWLMGCQKAEVPPIPYMKFIATPASPEPGEMVTLRVTVGDDHDGVRTGAVHLTTTSGSFFDAGLSADIELDATGQGRALWSCDCSQESNCADRVRLLARWEDGKTFLEKYIRFAHAPPTSEMVAGTLEDAGSGEPEPIFNGDDVYLFGSLNADTGGYYAISPIDRPQSPMYGFANQFQAAQPWPLMANGQLYYAENYFYSLLNRNVNWLYKFVPDAPRPTIGSDNTRYPIGPSTNDPLAAPYACFVKNYKVFPSGKVAYSCDSPNPEWVQGQWYVEDQPVNSLDTAVQVGFNDTMLSMDPSYMERLDGSHHVVFDVGQLLYVIGTGIGLSDSWDNANIVTRAHPEGFLIAAINGIEHGQQAGMALLRFDGQILFMGKYADVLTGYAKHWVPPIVMDGAGALFMMNNMPDTGGPGYNSVSRRPLLPGQSSLVYNELNAVGENWVMDPPALYNRIIVGKSVLVTGP